MRAYLDHAATTPMDSRIERVVVDNFKIFGNPSSLHDVGREAKKVIENSRKTVAGAIKAKPGEIIFTSSGTESANLAVFGVARANKGEGKHIITTSIEHLAVLSSFKKLEKEGFHATYVPPDKDGIVKTDDIKKELKKDTVLVSVMQANNEIGTIQPVKEIGEVIRNFRKENNNLYPYFHTDSCQAVGALNVRPNDLNADLMTFNGSKIYGPKGTGCLFVKRGVKLEPVAYGGNQESGLRAGTENAAFIVGFAKAVEIAEKGRIKNSQREEKLRDYCIKKILKEIPNSALNGHPQKRLPNNINISFKGVDGEMLMMYLNEKNIFVSTGSACTTKETGPSHVMKAIDQKSGWGNIRVTLGKSTTKKEVDYFLLALSTSVGKLRKL